MWRGGAEPFVPAPLPPSFSQSPRTESNRVSRLAHRTTPSMWWVSFVAARTEPAGGARRRNATRRYSRNPPPAPLAMGRLKFALVVWPGLLVSAQPYVGNFAANSSILMEKIRQDVMDRPYFSAKIPPTSGRQGTSGTAFGTCPRVLDNGNFTEDCPYYSDAGADVKMQVRFFKVRSVLAADGMMSLKVWQRMYAPRDFASCLRRLRIDASGSLPQSPRSPLFSMQVLERHPPRVGPGRVRRCHLHLLHRRQLRWRL